MAGLHNCEMAPLNGQWQVTGVLSIENVWWLHAADRFNLALFVGSREWLWRKIELRIVGNAIVANNLGEPERRKRRG